MSLRGEVQVSVESLGEALTFKPSLETQLVLLIDSSYLPFRAIRIAL